MNDFGVSDVGLRASPSMELGGRLLSEAGPIRCTMEAEVVRGAGKKTEPNQPTVRNDERAEPEGN